MQRGTYAASEGADKRTGTAAVIQLREQTHPEQMRKLPRRACFVKCRAAEMACSAREDEKALRPLETRTCPSAICSRRNPAMPSTPAV